MKRLWVNIVVIVALLLPSLREGACAQGRFVNYFDSDSFWRSITVLDSITSPLEGADTFVALVSSRVFDYGVLKFAKEESAKSGQLNYFLAFIKEGKWYVKPYNSLAEVLERQEHGNNLVVYTEGYGKNFPAGLFRAFSMNAQYKVNVLYLDYPSINSSKKRLGNWRFVLREADKAGADFVPVLDSLYRYPLREYYFPKITLFYHSMGNLALKHMLKNDLFPYFGGYVWVDNLVLNAACVPAKGYEDWLGKANFARQIIVHYNPDDRTLKGAQLVSGNRKIGTRPGKKMPERTVCINFNGFAGKGHNYFLNLPYRAPMAEPVAGYMQSVLNGNRINTRDSLVFRRLEGAGKFELVGQR